ncbi:U3 snoRNP protein [Lambiella insularis]|nr:U3 snoRNP protein [Lambiella insularis]
MAPGKLNSPMPSTSIAHDPSLARDGLHPPVDQLLLSTLSQSSHTFLQPTHALHTAALLLAKQYLDPLASTVSQAQAQRLQHARKKRKRGQDDDEGVREILRLKQVHLEGFGIDQVWEQARRVLDASQEEVERSLADISTMAATQLAPANGNASTAQIKMVRFDDDGFEVDDDDSDNGQDADLELEDMWEGGSELGDTDLVEKLVTRDESEEEGADLGDEEDIEYEGLELEMDDADDNSEEVYKPDKHGLNDGFFSIDDFNRNSEFLEQQDARGDPGDGAASDEEDIDWDADPMAQSLVAAAKPKHVNQDNEDDPDLASEEEDGPTFGNADLHAPFSDSDASSGSDLPIEDTLSNTNAIKYEDFFAPPPLATKKRAPHRPLPKTQPPPSAPSEDDIQRTISAVRRDLFEDDLSPQSSGAESPSHRTDLPNNLSSHQKRRAALAAQIRALEAASVAKRDWTLSGEARAAERPLNSLLEEDLEFERAGKPVPVITAAVSEDIEALIKRRILAREFDEVLRRRPGSLRDPASGEAVRRGRAELDDAKSKVGLGELYADEHLRAVDPAGYVDKRDAAVAKQHEAIRALWADVSAKLDALSSWHYRPRPPEVTVQVVSDVPAVRMEEARPSGVGGVGAGEGASMLAPQEVFTVGEGAGKEEVVRGAGMVSREEMSREERLRRRRREKEREKKREGGGRGKARVEAIGPKRAKGEKEVVDQLRKGGVKVIGKKGELKDVEGNLVKGRQGVKGAGNFKL